VSTPQTSAPARSTATPTLPPLGRNNTSRPTSAHSVPIASASAGSDFLDGQCARDTQSVIAVEGDSSPQASGDPSSIQLAPAGTTATAAANLHATTMIAPLLPCKTGQDAQAISDAQADVVVLAEDLLGDQPQADTQILAVAGDSAQPTAIELASPIHRALSAASSPREAKLPPFPMESTPLADQTPPLASRNSATMGAAPGVDQAGSPVPAIGDATAEGPSPELADPLLALAADVLDDLESVRIANENRLRQLTRDEEDSDGEERGFGLTLDHPDVARLAALVTALADAEKAATKNLEKRLKQHALYPWLKRQKGVGDKQAARLLASIGDPYMRPEMARQDGTVEPARPRMVSELWAYTGYHVLPAGHITFDSQSSCTSGGKTGHPGQRYADDQAPVAGVAPKRARGQRANWSATAKMRAFLIAESCMKQLKRTCPADEERGYATHAVGCECSTYRKVYDAAREKYADAIHHTECIRCGPKGKPAPPGSDLSRKHKQARALRIVSKELLKGLWREARRIHTGEEEIA
jgi:hypothetical protein